MIRVQGYVPDYDVVGLNGVTYVLRNVTIVRGAS
jgi:hypothetical protein